MFTLQPIYVHNTKLKCHNSSFLLHKPLSRSSIIQRQYYIGRKLKGGPLRFKINLFDAPYDLNLK